MTADGARPEAAGVVITAIRGWSRAAGGVLVVAVDGRGGSGKTTIAAAVAGASLASVVHTDDFFQWPAAGHLGCAGASGPAAGPPPLDRYYDWPRIRAEALEPLRAGRAATFRRFDWESGGGLDGPVTVEPTGLIVLEGVFSAAPELADLVDRAVLVETPATERIRRLRARLTQEEWDEDWLSAEQAYFSAVRPPASFSLVVRGVSDAHVSPA
jgi:uridine kinase